MITAKPFVLQKQENTNADIISHILENILNIPYARCSNRQFPAGNMFFGKTLLFKRIFSDTIIDQLTPHLLQETGKVSDIKYGTYCHSLERIFGYITTYQNNRIASGVVPTIKVLNAKAVDHKHKLHIIPIYDHNACYLLEDMHVCGKILLVAQDQIVIEWHHLSKPTIRKYRYLNRNTIIPMAN